MVNDLTENNEFLAKFFNNPQISPLQNIRKYSEDTGLGKQKSNCFFSRYKSTKFVSTSDETHHIPLKFSIAVGKLHVRTCEIQVCYLTKHNCMLDILKKYSYVFSGHVTYYFLF